MPSPLPPASNSRRHPVPPLGRLGVTYMGLFLAGLYPVTIFGGRPYFPLPSGPLEMNHDSVSRYRKYLMSAAVELAGRIANACIRAIAMMAMLSTLSFAQLLVPVDVRMPAPGAFDFRGTWRCQGRLDSATLEVGTQHPYRWKRSKRHTGRDDLNWTALTEKESGFTGHYRVAYDRDTKQFVMIDADDAAYAAYTIDQWENETLVLTSFSAAQSSGWHFRWVYELHGVDQFKVSFETEDAMTWTTQSTCVCQRTHSIVRNQKETLQ